METDPVETLTIQRDEPVKHIPTLTTGPAALPANADRDLRPAVMAATSVPEADRRPHSPTDSRATPPGVGTARRSEADPVRGWKGNLLRRCALADTVVRTARRIAAVELWLVAVDGSGSEREIAVEADSTHRIAELAEALGWDRCRLVLERTGQQIDPDATVVDAGLRTGDVLVLRGRRREGRRAGTELVVAGGPAAGLVVPLEPGTTIVGRGTTADALVADPTMSRQHVRLDLSPDGTVTVADAGSTHGTFILGQPLTEPQTLEPGVLVEAGNSVLRVQRPPDDAAPVVLREGRLQFSRPPRRVPRDLTATRSLPAPPDPLGRRRIPLATSLLPLAAAPVMAVGGNNAGFLALAALSPVMAVASVLEDRRFSGKDRKESLHRFRTELDKAEEQALQGLRQEAVARWAAAPDPVEVRRRAEQTSSRLWERRPGDPDFLRFRVGWADQPSSVTWALKEGGEEAEREQAERRMQHWTVARSVPVVVDLVGNGVVGLAGDREDVDETARWLVTQLATAHSPRNVVLAVAVDDSRAHGWTWTGWLPHADAEGVPFSAHPLAIGSEEARGLVASLNELVRSRRERAKDRSAGAADSLPAVVVVLDQHLQVPRSAVATLLEEGPAVGVRVVWLGTRTSGLPGEAGVVLERAGSTVLTTTVATGEVVGPAPADRLSVDEAVKIGRRLACLRDATARGRTGELPSRVALPDILTGGPGSDAVERRWKSAGGSLAAPIGIGEDGLFALDLRKDGPHALLGGTTGAGKSELLQTFVASLAACVPPDRLTFLLVDYKGGAAFKDCVELPHVVGMVTDLDSHLVHRALVSLNAELHRRERILAAAGAKDLIEMERTQPDEAPASLFLIVDEFATLAKELPDFVDGVVNVAQRGRSLGIHMLLATQRPAGAINDNIRANTNLRMALRMNDVADSQDVIDHRAAADLPRSLPGRAFIRTGASELSEVQVAYAGGYTLTGGHDTPLRVRPLRHGRVVADEIVAVVEEHPAGRTDLQEVVAAVREASARLQLRPQPRPWLPPLPDVVSLDALAPSPESALAVVGVVDVPSRQAQEPCVVDLPADGNLLVLGTSGSGKTTLLRTLAVALARTAPADRLHLYGLDFATRGLGAIEALPHCGGVVNGDDIDRVQRLFRMLDRWVDDRKRRFGEAGASTLEEYDRLAGDSAPLPRVVVLLDSYGGFASVFEKVDHGARLDAFPRLLSEGRPLGLHFVVTADRPTALPLAVQSSIQAKLVLRLADPDDYGASGLDVRVARGAALGPGRGFDAATRELQVALVGTEPAGDAQARAVQAVGRRLGRPAPGSQPAVVGALPTAVALTDVLAAAAPLRPVVGIGDDDLAPVRVDLGDGHVLVAGANRSGKSTTLAAIAAGLRSADPALEMHLVAPRRSPLLHLDIWTSSVRRQDDIDALCLELQGRVQERDEGDPPVVVVVDDGHELADSAADAALEQIARRGRDVGAYIVGAAEVAAAQRSYGGWIPEVRKDRQGVLLQPDPDVDGDLLGARLRRARIVVPGRGVLVRRGEVEVVQVAR